MVLVLHQQETMEKQLQVKTTRGKGILYITNFSIIIEIEKKGNLLELQHSQIASLEATSKNKIKVSWPEGRHLHSFEFKTNDAKLHVKEIVEKHNYEENFPDLIGVTTVPLTDKDRKQMVQSRTKLVDKKIEEVSKELEKANLVLNMIASEDPDKTEKILTASKVTGELQTLLTMWENYKRDLPNIKMNRSKKIPKEIPNEDCWNDSWYDKKYGCFVTFNPVWNNPMFDKYENIQKFKKENIIPNAYPVPNEAIWYMFGYPIISPKVIDIDSGLARFLLPTMTDDMLTDEIISCKTGYETGEDYMEWKAVPTKITVLYTVKEGSKMILKNGERFKYTFKEAVFLNNRRLFTKEEQALFP